MVATPAFLYAMEEISLVVFTTLAPTGVLACAAVLAILAVTRRDEAARTRLAHLSILPLAVSMVGLVASATHLGTPSNALYVLAGVGRSPLSNEVACMVVFLALGGLHWLYSFSLRVNRALQRAWCVLTSAFGIAALVSIAFAYNEAAIVTWTSPYVPLSLVFSGLAGCPVLLYATLQAARYDVSQRQAAAMAAVGTAATATCTICLGLQCAWLGTVRNAVGYAIELAPGFSAVVAAYCVCGLVATALALAPALLGKNRDSGADNQPKPARHTGARLALACAVYFAGLFCVRFCFYMTHMTAGISL